MSSAQKGRKKTAFVPRIIFQAAAVVGVLPLCAGCTGTVVPGGVAVLGFTEPGGDSGLSVANIGFDGGGGDTGLSVANIGFDGGGGDTGLSVANIGFDGGSDTGLGVAAMGFDGGGDTGLSVAAMGFDASDDGPSLGVALEAFGHPKS